jgi:hypothetical protein
VERFFQRELGCAETAVCSIWPTFRMALSLNDKETERLAREVAALTDETLTVAIRKALVERLDRERLRRGEST